MIYYMKKNIILITVIVIVIFAAGSVWWWQQQSNRVIPSNSDQLRKDYKIYQNKIIGIEFQYPNDWATLEPDDRGDDEGNSFNLDLPDLSHLDHTFLDYDNLSIDEQYEQIKCDENELLLNESAIECQNRISSNGVKYVWRIDQIFDFIDYSALVATGKYILVFSFQDKDNYQKRAAEYQQLLSTLKIPE